MEIKHLRYFLAVAREENMTKAADMLHVTQPTLSKTLKTLEDELGKKLFTRHSFSISLTDEGIILFPFYLPILFTIRFFIKFLQTCIFNLVLLYFIARKPHFADI